MGSSVLMISKEVKLPRPEGRGFPVRKIINIFI
jgi:hypothetical protein